MKGNFSSVFVLVITLLLTGCAQYRCYDGTYVEDPYDCFNHGGLSYFSSSINRAKAKASKTLTGTWNVTGSLSSKSCPTLNNQVSTPIKITQLPNGVISIRSLAGYGAATTKLRKNRTSIPIKRNSILYNIQGLVNVSFAANNNNATLSATGNAKFLGGQSCDLSLKATAQKR